MKMFWELFKKAEPVEHDVPTTQTIKDAAVTDVSEPVLSFIKTFLDNPKRFVLLKPTEESRMGIETYVIDDTHTGERFDMDLILGHWYVPRYNSNTHAWLTHN